MACRWICVGGILRRILPSTQRFFPRLRRNSANAPAFSQDKLRSRFDRGALQDSGLPGIASECSAISGRRNCRTHEPCSQAPLRYASCLHFERTSYTCIQRRTGFKCEHVITANCDFSPSMQLLQRNVYITHSINQYIARA